MLGKKMEEALNRQVNAEFYSAYLYLSASAWFANKNLPGFANWMRVQTMEESTHAIKIYNFINSRGGTVKLTTVEGPKTDWPSPLAIFQDALAHERKVSAMIDDLVDTAAKERDHASGIMLQWFVTEQVEEESNAEAIVRQLGLAGENPNALLMLDREMGARTFVNDAGV